MMKSTTGLLILLTMAGCNTPEKKTQSTEMNQTFTMPAWAQSTNIYEVNLRQYTPEGTINAFAAHLPRLKEMGVQTLWFMPITPIAQKNKKGTLGSYYACSDYTAVSPEFGSLADFRNLVKQAHELGMKVIMDWVANHTGWDHVWTKEHPEWYLKDSTTNDFQIASGMDDIIELDFSNRDLRKAMVDAMKFWITECDIDGFRADLAFWVELDFWQEARAELEKTKQLFWLGELDPLDHPEYMGVFDAAYTWSWMHKAKEFYQNKLTISVLDSLLDKYESLGNKTTRAWFTTNHDENSWNGTEYEKYGDMARSLAVFSCTWNGIPLLYSGQEVPNTKRLEFFEKDPIDWSPPHQLHGFYKTLLELHSFHPALRAGDPDVVTEKTETTAPGQVFAFKRTNGDREVRVFLNWSSEPVRFRVSDDSFTGSCTDVFRKEVMLLSPASEFVLNAWDFRVLEK